MVPAPFTPPDAHRTVVGGPDAPRASPAGPVGRGDPRRRARGVGAARPTGGVRDPLRSVPGPGLRLLLPLPRRARGGAGRRRGDVPQGARRAARLPAALLPLLALRHRPQRDRRRPAPGPVAPAPR